MEGSKAYRFRMALQYVSPKIWRCIEVEADSSLAELQRFIPDRDGLVGRVSTPILHSHFLGTARPGRLLLFVDPAQLPNSSSHSLDFASTSVSGTNATSSRRAGSSWLNVSPSGRC